MGLDDQGLISGRDFLFATGSRLAVGPTQSPIQWVSGAVSARLKWLGNEADTLSPSSAEVRNAWSYASIPLYVFMTCLVKQRDKFTCMYS
jgi:hypothetical protein